MKEHMAQSLKLYDAYKRNLEEDVGKFGNTVFDNDEEK